MDSITFYSIFSLVIIQFFALLSPGPDFIFISCQAMMGTIKKQMLQAIFGISTGVFFWANLSLLGLSKIFNTYPAIETIIAFLSGCYLLYIAYQIYQTRKNNNPIIVQSTTYNNNLYFKGLIINLLNPKAMIYFMVIFAPFVEKFHSFSIKIITLTIIVIETFLWFYIISIIFSHRQLRAIYIQYQVKFNIASATVFLLFAILIFHNFYPQFLQLVT